MTEINTLGCGTNHGALRIISRRVEENVARAILRIVTGKTFSEEHIERSSFRCAC